MFDLPDDVNDLFGPVIFQYSDADAVNDGILIPFLGAGFDSRHRITSNAFHDLNEHHQPAYPSYKNHDFLRFYFAELLPLIPAAFDTDKRHRRYLTTDFDFRCIKYEPSRHGQLWYVPNEVGGITMMLPSDY